MKCLMCQNDAIEWFYVEFTIINDVWLCQTCAEKSDRECNPNIFGKYRKTYAEAEYDLLLKKLS